MECGKSCCQVESIISVDERGQLVLPKDVRIKAGIRSGDKLAVVSWRREDKICCISLIKTENFGGVVRTILGPMMKEIAQLGEQNDG